ncbi:MAG: hypothetical protein Q4C49_05365 [Bacillota bacterium]|nr:hypothetical protein [Bacillota bacterium]
MKKFRGIIVILLVAGILVPNTAWNTPIYASQNDVMPIVKKEKVDIQNVSINLTKQLVYNGNEQVQEVILRYGNKTLREKVDYVLEDNVAKEVGNYVLKIVGKGSFTGQVEVLYSIHPLPSSEEKINIAKASIKLKSPLVYNGKEQEQEITLHVGNKRLVENKDYFVEQNKAKDVGEYTLIIHGKGDYEGSKKVSFSVLPEEKHKPVHTGMNADTELFLLLSTGSIVSVAGTIICSKGKKQMES